MIEKRFIKRDISWLAFNHRVLQEAADPTVPLFERIRFLAIFSSNLDEFFRVRVASHRQFKDLEKETRKALDDKPKKTLKQIRIITHEQQKEFGHIFRTQILPALEAEGIYFYTTEEMSPADLDFAGHFFEQNLLPALLPKVVHSIGEPPFLMNKGLYFAVHLGTTDKYGLVNIPETVDRFVRLPAKEKKQRFCFVDEILRLHIHRLFTDHRAAFAIKLSRDAGLYIEDEFSGDLLNKIRSGLNARDSGDPTRFLYDDTMPADFLRIIKANLRLNKNELIPGARYHNFNDFFQFPELVDAADHSYPPLKPLAHAALEKASSLLDHLQGRDEILHFPYQRFDYVVRLLEEAAIHAQVRTIQITLYRVSSDSAVVRALLQALQQGKDVFVFVELKARFDEESNWEWGDTLTEAGAVVRYSYPGIKVHSKVCTISFQGDSGMKDIAYVGTGNLNEHTAKVYCDHGLLTGDPRITREIASLFEVIRGALILPDSNHLLISPFNLRRKFEALIDFEMHEAQQGRPAWIVIKLNNLEDRRMIDKLYAASQAGVRVEIIVRSICCLKPGIDGLSDNMHVISIVDRFLEHARVFMFGHAGNPTIYLGSADWMTRNLDRRIEVVVPVFQAHIREELQAILELQLRDNVKARIVHSLHSNAHKRPGPGEAAVRAQYDTYTLLSQKLELSEPKLESPQDASA